MERTGTQETIGQKGPEPLNLTKAIKIIDYLVHHWGVRSFCLCAGARNAPFVQLLGESKGLEVISFFDERAASFYALGRIQRDHRPVAVITTSGSAAGELLPATMEAYYSGYPLLLVTADRPRRFRGSAAPQSAEQVGLFSHYIRGQWDGESQTDLEKFPEPEGGGPFHLNVCFEEPLKLQDVPSLDYSPAMDREFQRSQSPLNWFTPKEWMTKEESLLKARDFVKCCTHPLIILGKISSIAQQEVFGFLKKHPNILIYAETISGLRSLLAQEKMNILAGEKELELLAGSQQVDGVVRVGGVPTTRFWRNLEDKWSALPVLSFSDLPFSGLGRTEERALPLHHLWDLDFLSKGPSELEGKSSGEKRKKAFLSRDGEIHQEMHKIVFQNPLSEPSLLSDLSQLIREGDTLFLGNSLAIRTWDLLASYKKTYKVYCQRGLNGIDGLVSGFLGSINQGRADLGCIDQGSGSQARADQGLAERDSLHKGFRSLEKRESNSSIAWALIGDLSALYDLNGLWPLVRDPVAGLRLVVVNNKGGKIFNRMFQQPLFENGHKLNFSHWARMFQLKYLSVSSTKEIQELSQLNPKDSYIIELLPDQTQTDQFWDQYTQLWESQK